MDEIVHAHSGYVQVAGSTGHFGVCGSCGWMGPDRPSRDRAEADIAAHVARTGYRWDAANARLEKRL